ncbi:NAD(P)H-dependent oxidoreductase [Massilia sp. TW-1]|uniref:NAD(P)H-dependent oxidoreductase n=1 Tax=Telluria antibiotica TaxID=2717319 RepID=A0ABX0PA29_9BURK|nr:NADPH-dependent FMN reductase [Telluria antibiotica]NIA53771.1 NAD(P)H-dependent oxidoreductase [Telluria antibiotica]
MSLRILALCGSQRARSLTAGLLRACQRLAPAGVAIDCFEQHKDFPLFNPERTDVPPGVLALQDAITAADALLIASPEYAHGVTGTIKNTLDWVVNHAPFAGKPVAVLNPSYQSFHADEALKETLRTMSADLVLDACLRIPVIGSGADPDRIHDIPRFAVSISAALRALIAHAERTAGARPTAE